MGVSRPATIVMLLPAVAMHRRLFKRGGVRVLMGMPMFMRVVMVMPMRVLVLVLVRMLRLMIVMLMVVMTVGGMLSLLVERHFAIGATANRTHHSTSSSFTFISSPPVTCS